MTRQRPDEAIVATENQKKEEQKEEEGEDEEDEVEYVPEPPIKQAKIESSQNLSDQDYLARITSESLSADHWTVWACVEICEKMVESYDETNLETEEKIIALFKTEREALMCTIMKYDSEDNTLEFTWEDVTAMSTAKLRSEVYRAKVSAFQNPGEEETYGYYTKSIPIHTSNDLLSWMKDDQRKNL